MAQERENNGNPESPNTNVSPAEGNDKVLPKVGEITDETFEKVESVLPSDQDGWHFHEVNTLSEENALADVLRLREEIYPWTKHEIQFDNAGYNHPTDFVKKAAVRYLEEGLEKFGEVPKAARKELAQMIGADLDEGMGSKEIAFVPNTTIGIQNIAQNFKWEPGDKVVVLKKAYEFPTNYRPWKALEKRGVELIEIGDEKGCVTPEEIERVLQQNPRILALSTVGWKTGQRIDLEKIASLVKRHNLNSSTERKAKTRFCLDAIQSLGTESVDVKALGVDYLASGGSKWLMAGSGNGFMYCSQDALQDLDRDGMLGENWSDSDSIPKENASYFEGGSKMYLNAACLGVAATLVNRIGIQNIRERILDLRKYFSKKMGSDFEIWSSVDEHGKAKDEKSSSLILFRKKEWGDGRVDEIQQKLVEKTDGIKPIKLVVRDGYLRASIHYYNTESEIDELMKRLEEL